MEDPPWALAPCRETDTAGPVTSCAMPNDVRSTSSPTDRTVALCHCGTAHAALLGTAAVTETVRQSALTKADAPSLPPSQFPAESYQVRCAAPASEVVVRVAPLTASDAV